MSTPLELSVDNQGTPFKVSADTQTTHSQLSAGIQAKSKTVNVRSVANIPEKPQLAESLATGAQSPEQYDIKAQIQPPNTKPTGLAPQDVGGPFQTFRTHVKIFLLSTGDDPGSDAEIRVSVGIVGFPIASASTDLPILSSWGNENGGLGHTLADQTRDNVGAPLSFGGYVDENDTFGQDVILQYTVDFTKPEWIQYADGNAWVVRSWNQSDPRYVVNLWWQITQV